MEEDTAGPSRILRKFSHNNDKSNPQIMRKVLVDPEISMEDQEDSTIVDCANELAVSSFPNFCELRR